MKQNEGNAENNGRNVRNEMEMWVGEISVGMRGAWMEMQKM